MPGRSKRTLAALLIAAATVAGVAGCGGSSEETSGKGAAATGGTASEVNLKGASFTVGSKEFTEQLILGQITIQALEAAGAEVKNQTGIEGSTATRDALTSGQIDMYWGYTGTAWVDYLEHEEGIPNEARQFEALKKADASNGISWIDLAPMNDTYAIAVRSKAGSPLDEVKTLSGLAELANKSPELATICVGSEFAHRPDGLAGVEKVYGFKFPKNQVSLVGDSVVYEQVAKGSRCNFGSVFSTDGRIESLKLRVLEDNKHLFPFYNVALSIRSKVLEKYPQIEKLFEPVAAALTTEEITKLNAKVDVEGQTAAHVASEFLAEKGIVG